MNLLSVLGYDYLFFITARDNKYIVKIKLKESHPTPLRHKLHHHLFSVA